MMKATRKAQVLLRRRSDRAKRSSSPMRSPTGSESVANGSCRTPARLSDQWRNVSGRGSALAEHPIPRHTAEFGKIDCAEIVDCRFSLELFGAGTGRTRRTEPLWGQSHSFPNFNDIARNRWLACHLKSTKSTKVICQHFREA